MNDDIIMLIQALTGRDTKAGCAAMDRLVELSAESDAVSQYIGAFIKMLSHSNSYVRNRAITLLAANAVWDKRGEICGSLSVLTALLSDQKPITVRTAVKALTQIAVILPMSREAIVSAFEAVDTQKYKDSMRPLIEADIRAARAIITH